MAVHSFTDVTPHARFDGVAWTHVRVEEAADPAGPWTQIAQLPIALDATPESADPVNITVTTATIDAGWFRFRFVDGADGTSSYTAAVYSPSATMGGSDETRLINPRGSRFIHVPDARQITEVTVDDVVTTDYKVLERDGAPVRIELPRRAWVVAVTGTFGYATRADVTPTIAQVAALEHARTNSAGSEAGTFDETTIPTGDQVQELIELAVDDVLARVDAELPFAYAGDARRLAALQAATLIESSYFPNELESDSSAYRQYSAMFLNGIPTLIANARRAALGGLG